MADCARTKAQRLRDLGERAQRRASEILMLADQAEQPSRSIGRAERLISLGEELASDLNDVAGSVRRVFRG